MVKPITMERWRAAQLAERDQHTMNYAEGYMHYMESYQHYFRYLGMDFSQGGKSIIEVGPADFPALAYCSDYAGTIIEPMPSPMLEEFCEVNGVLLLPYPLEGLTEIVPISDEIWLFNVMQHIIDPEIFIEKCKIAAAVVRFFEPIDEKECIYHPHAYDEYDFREFFPGAVKIYRDKVPGFHQATCAYGCFVNNP